MSTEQTALSNLPITETMNSIFGIEGWMVYLTKGFIRAVSGGAVGGMAVTLIAYHFAGPVLPFMVGSSAGFSCGWIYTYYESRNRLLYLLHKYPSIVKLEYERAWPEFGYVFNKKWHDYKLKARQFSEANKASKTPVPPATEVPAKQLKELCSRSLTFLLSDMSWREHGMMLSIVPVAMKLVDRVTNKKQDLLVDKYVDSKSLTPEEEDAFDS